MIKVEKLAIREFRGIRNLTIKFDRKNFAICGPNGTGKSGVVDALEFALTGGISRLAGRGTGDVSVAKHGPHVDSRDKPDKARVTLEVWIPEIQKKATIERSVANPTAPVIHPNEPAVVEVFRQAQLHPEFALSRRELIRYVISAPGDRAKEVQALLRLDQVEDIRSDLQRVANSAQRSTKPLAQEKLQAREALLRALDIPDLNEAKLLAAVNARRKLLGLAEIEKLAPTTSLRDGLSVQASAQAIRVPKPQATADSKRARAAVDKLRSPELTATRNRVRERLVSLGKDAAALANVQREGFLRTAVTYVESDVCPVCDTEWKPGELRAKLNVKLGALKEATRKRNATERELEPILAAVQEAMSTVSIVDGYASQLSPAVDSRALKEWVAVLGKKIESLRALLPLDEANAALEDLAIPNEAERVLIKITEGIDAIPQPTDQDAAQVYLTIGQERLENYRAVSLRHKAAEEQAALAKKIYDAYARVSTEVLDGIYKQVEKGFSDLYRYINRDDEGGFTARLTPSIGRLGFDVDFYGRGYFPPGAYHSEGHQDGMGLCLYLALMSHLQGGAFTFAVLDDVLMSVDTGHRREVCNLLREKFPDTQFVLTTHDKIWLNHMRTVGVIPQGAAAHFRRWTVDHGPADWNDRDIWTEIDAEVQAGNIKLAAALLRNHLEYIAAAMAHGIRARVEYREDAQYQLGDLLPPVLGRFRDLFKVAKTSAASWSKPADQIVEREKDFSVRAEASQAEQWALNPAIHYNQWENFGIADFKPVVAAFAKLVEAFACPTCSGLLYVSPPKGASLDALRCGCGDVNINLKAFKPSDGAPRVMPRGGAPSAFEEPQKAKTSAESPKAK